jgi:hypothetical protein
MSLNQFYQNLLIDIEKSLNALIAESLRAIIGRKFNCVFITANVKFQGKFFLIKEVVGEGQG